MEKLNVSPSPATEKIGPSDREFSRRVTAQVGNLARCYQCSMCSDGCPVAYAMDYYPNQLIHLVRLGQKNKVLESKSIWLCASCETCATRCPNQIEIVHMMDVLRRESMAGGFKGPLSNVAKFHQAFVNQIKTRGRVDEARLLIDYELRSRGFLSFAKFREEAKLGLEMFRKGKIKFPSMKRHSPKAIKSVFKKVFSQAKA
jgi:heterodisulfide reductase subunit C2